MKIKYIMYVLLICLSAHAMESLPPIEQKLSFFARIKSLLSHLFKKKKPSIEVDDDFEILPEDDAHELTKEDLEKLIKPNEKSL